MPPKQLNKKQLAKRREERQKRIARELAEARTIKRQRKEQQLKKHERRLEIQKQLDDKVRRQAQREKDERQRQKNASKQKKSPVKKRRRKNPVHKKQPSPIRKQQKEIIYNPDKWITITFHKKPVGAFFPSNIFPEAIDSQRMNYLEAKNKPLDYWKDKKIIFHMADKDRGIWIPYYKDVIKSAKIAWIKFVAGVFMTDMTQLDRRRYSQPVMKTVPLSFFRMIDDACDNILWELPLNYEGFWKEKNIVPMTLYDVKYEFPIKEKSIDFLAVIDDRLYYNYIKTLELMRRLSQAGYKVKCILIRDSGYLFKNYTKQTIGFETIPNGKDRKSQKIFYDLCQQTKIMIDLSFRWTYGRVVYEALFNGALSICTNTYGASHHLFPDLMVDTSNFSMKDTYKKCVDLVEKWTPKLVKDYRKRAVRLASPQIFAEKLNKETDRILGLK